MSVLLSLIGVRGLSSSISFYISILFFETISPVETMLSSNVHCMVLYKLMRFPTWKSITETRVPMESQKAFCFFVCGALISLTDKSHRVSLSESGFQMFPTLLEDIFVQHMKKNGSRKICTAAIIELG